MTTVRYTQAGWQAIETNEGVYEGLFLQTFVKRTVINKKHPTFLPSVNPKILSKEGKLLLSVGN